MDSMQIRVRGPVFDGRAHRAAADYAEAVEGAVAKEGLRMATARFRQVLRHPTGYYVSHVRVRETAGRHVVTDGGVVYGPWLEGVGSRNFPETRFRGYSTFRRTQALLDRRATNIAEREWSRFAGRMG
ncbi:hypothetical protein LHJ74_14730 [Streptomyces sp. N2-109]|uniref:HK97 gp10 family phage protein n=1 Tax=Streptomyces gossypii TaxID=2883101 RepID=A0ABT2JTC9_9ACTN|nr:hypothetical protein [Streptomyces gossypii]MCT2591147.1 hypothetical protein [Streptomyces gossypii]